CARFVGYDYDGYAMDYW
nr:immunoglobulin heavy chain junction region [Mus musculus]